MKPQLTIAQGIGEKPVYDINDLSKRCESRATAYRTLHGLLEAGFAERIKQGHFTVRSSLFQPFTIWMELHASLQSLKQARFFGSSYNENDVRRAREILKGIITLDYRAYELTQFQIPRLFSIYVQNVNQASRMLKDHGFSEGTRGRVALMPRIGTFENEIQRVYLDCIAYGGRSQLDAIAIEILHEDKLDPHVRGMFKTEDVLKVQGELAPQSSTRSNHDHIRTC